MWFAVWVHTVIKVERTRKAVRTARFDKVKAKTALDLVRRVFIVSVVFALRSRKSLRRKGTKWKKQPGQTAAHSTALLSIPNDACAYAILSTADSRTASRHHSQSAFHTNTTLHVASSIQLLQIVTYNFHLNNPLSCHVFVKYQSECIYLTDHRNVHECTQM